MAKRRSRHGEPWEHDKSVVGALGIKGTSNKGNPLCIKDRYGFILDKDLRRAIACVNACAGLTAKQLKHGVKPKEEK